MAKRKAGELSAALSELESWLARYPDSVLQQEARVERFRLLASLGRSAEAARAARSYLGDYPDGYARNLTDGIIRARYRQGTDTPRVGTPSASSRSRAATAICTSEPVPSRITSGCPFEASAST